MELFLARLAARGGGDETPAEDNDVADPSPNEPVTSTAPDGAQASDASGSTVGEELDSYVDPLPTSRRLPLVRAAPGQNTKQNTMRSQAKKKGKTFKKYVQCSFVHSFFLCCRENPMLSGSIMLMLRVFLRYGVATVSLSKIKKLNHQVV